MKKAKVKKLLTGIGIAGLVANMTVNGYAGSGSSCGKGSCGKSSCGAKKGFFQKIYDGISGEDEGASSCGKGASAMNDEAKSSCGKGSCGKGSCGG